MIRRRRWFAVAVMLIVAVAARPAAGDDRTPPVVVAEFQNSLIAIMKEAAALGFSGRYQRLLPPIERAFHLPLMVRIATGAHWAQADADQRRRLIDAFRRMSVSTVATLFDDYGGEAFEPVGERPGPQRTRLVESNMTFPDKSPINFVYVAKKIDGRWYLIDVVVDKGISELNVRRSEYNLVLKESGVEGLIDALNRKADELVAQ